MGTLATMSTVALPRAPRATRATLGEVGLAAVVAVGVGSAFLPWAASGRAERNSFELVSLAEQLDLLPRGTHVLAVLWPALPLLASVAVAATVLSRPRLAGTAAVLSGAWSAAVAIAVLRSPLAPRPGVGLALGAAALSIVLGAGRLLPAAARRAHPPGGPRERPAPPA